MIFSPLFFEYLPEKRLLPIPKDNFYSFKKTFHLRPYLFLSIMRK